MALERSSLFGVLRQAFLAILLLFLCSVPFFYADVLLDFGNAYLIARLLRLLAVVIITCAIGKRSGRMIAQNAAQGKKFIYFILNLIFASICLHVGGITSDLYGTISHAIGIFDRETTPLFLTILWEQLFAGELYWSILLCWAVVFFPALTAGKAQMQKR